jgi:hypothetical protein
MLICIYVNCSHTNALNFVMPIKYQYIYLALAVSAVKTSAILNSFLTVKIL